MTNVYEKSDYGLRTLKSEVWKPVKGYEGLYTISNFGHIRSYHIRTRGKALKSSLSGGYLTVHLRKNGKRKHAHVHKLVALAFLGDPPAPEYNYYLKRYILYIANHKDGIKTNNNTGNLEWKTVSEDALHAYALGLRHASGWTYNKEGETNPSAKLTEEDIPKIRKLVECDRLTCEQVSERFQVTKSTISRIVRRKTWRHI